MRAFDLPPAVTTHKASQFAKDEDDFVLIMRCVPKTKTRGGGRGRVLSVKCHVQVR